MTVFVTTNFFRGEVGQRDVKNKVCEVSNDRMWWSRAWRRQREGPVVDAQSGEKKRNQE